MLSTLLPPIKRSLVAHIVLRLDRIRQRLWTGGGLELQPGLPKRGAGPKETSANDGGKSKPMVDKVLARHGG
jgi:hypothetical protein